MCKGYLNLSRDYAMGWTVRGSNPGRGKSFLSSLKSPDPFNRLFHAFRGSFPGIKGPGREADNLPPYRAAVKNG